MTPTLERELTYLLEVEGPLTSGDGSPDSDRRQFWQMVRASLYGPRIRARSAMPGIDWFTPIGGGFGRPHVRMPFHTADGALILLEYHGLVHATDAFTKAVANDSETSWDDQYMRMTMTFDTTSSHYRWLTESIFIARGRLLGSKRIEYEVFRLT